MRVTKAAEAGDGMAFAGLVWKPVVLVEMKERGVRRLWPPLGQGR